MGSAIFELECGQYSIAMGLVNQEPYRISFFRMGRLKELDFQ